MTRRMLLVGLPWSMVACERYFEVFCVDESGTRHAAVVPEWLALPDLRSRVMHLSPEFHLSFGIREMVQTPLGIRWEKRSKVWRLMQPPA